MRRAADIRRWCLCMVLSLGMGAGAAAGTAVEPPPDELTGRILALEDSGRARPFEAAQALEALLPATAAHGMHRLELLTVQGLVLAAAAPSETIEPAASRRLGRSD